jgi:hypothetical protein
MVGLFGLLGVPLEIVLSLPSGGEPDAAASHGQSLWPAGWPAPPTLEGQAEWGSSFAGLALSAPNVRAVTWDHWHDGETHFTPCGGLIDANGHPKPLLSRLRMLRTAHLR